MFSRRVKWPLSYIVVSEADISLQNTTDRLFCYVEPGISSKTYLDEGILCYGNFSGTSLSCVSRCQNISNGGHYKCCEVLRQNYSPSNFIV